MSAAESELLKQLSEIIGRRRKYLETQMDLIVRSDDDVEDRISATNATLEEALGASFFEADEGFLMLSEEFSQARKRAEEAASMTEDLERRIRAHHEAQVEVSKKVQAEIAKSRETAAEELRRKLAINKDELDRQLAEHTAKIEAERAKLLVKEREALAREREATELRDSCAYKIEESRLQHQREKEEAIARVRRDEVTRVEREKELEVARIKAQLETVSREAERVRNEVVTKLRGEISSLTAQSSGLRRELTEASDQILSMRVSLEEERRDKTIARDETAAIRLEMEALRHHLEEQERLSRARADADAQRILELQRQNEGFRGWVERTNSIISQKPLCRTVGLTVYRPT